MQEPLAGIATAISCLVRLSVRNGGAARIEAARSSIDLAGETLPLSHLTRLAAEFGLQAEWIRLDWQGLKTAVSAQPLLIVRDNTEVVVVTGGGRAGAEEVSVWDPHHDGVVFFVSREDFERTWSGHALLINPKDAVANVFDTSPTAPDMPERQRSPRKSWTALRMSLGVAATGLVASLGMVLFLLTPPDVDQTAVPGTPPRPDSVEARNPLVNRREATSAAGVAATAPVLLTPEAASISSTPSSTGPRDTSKPDDTAPPGAPKREASPATQSHL